MSHRIALVTVRSVLRAPFRGRYAAVTRPDAPRRPYQPSFSYALSSLARRSALGRQLTTPEARHVG